MSKKKPLPQKNKKKTYEKDNKTNLNVHIVNIS